MKKIRPAGDSVGNMPSGQPVNLDTLPDLLRPIDLKLAESLSADNKRKKDETVEAARQRITSTYTPQMNITLDNIVQVPDSTGKNQLALSLGNNITVILGQGNTNPMVLARLVDSIKAGESFPVEIDWDIQFKGASTEHTAHVKRITNTERLLYPLNPHYQKGGDKVTDKVVDTRTIQPKRNPYHEIETKEGVFLGQDGLPYSRTLEMITPTDDEAKRIQAYGKEHRRPVEVTTGMANWRSTRTEWKQPSLFEIPPEVYQPRFKVTTALLSDIRFNRKQEELPQSESTATAGNQFSHTETSYIDIECIAKTTHTTLYDAKGDFKPTTSYSKFVHTYPRYTAINFNSD